MKKISFGNYPQTSGLCSSSAQWPWYLTFALLSFLLGCLCDPVINWVFGRLRRKTAIRGGKTRGSGTEKICSHRWFHMIFSCTEPCTDTFCTSSPLPLKNPQGVANLGRVVQSWLKLTQG